MILNRLLLRLAAVSALSNYQETPYPTLAGPHIFDSRVDPVATLKGDAVFPICVVYTDYDKDALTFKGLQTRTRLLTVTLELFVGQVKEDPNQGFELALPDTDSDLELSLDVFEAQIYDALGAGTLAADTFNTIAYGFDSVVSRRGASYEGGQKLAARQITLEVKCLREPPPGIVPEYMDGFLRELETRGEYADRASIIRDYLARHGGVGEDEATIRFHGYSEATAGNLGYGRAPAVRLGTPVRWFTANGQPLS